MWRRRLRRFLILLAVAVPLSGGALWWAIHRYPTLGSSIADGLRSVLGTEAVTWLEETAYGVQDEYNQWTRADEAPKAYWEVPSGAAIQDDAPPSAEGSAAKGDPSKPARPPFRPKNVGPVHQALYAKGDGVWVPVTDPFAPEQDLRLFKTLIHPDRKRPWAELFVVAVDLRYLDLHLVAGTEEPKATTPEARSLARPGLVPEADREDLVAVFNGGFKTEHGRWGMMIDEAVFVKPRPHGCTIAKSPDGALMVEPWGDDFEKLHAWIWWRQTPPCMIRRGERHGALWDPEARGWGAALEGETVIRRSAVGLTSDRQTLFVGISNNTTAQALANGMLHAGAFDVAQLDVNFSFPKFLLFPLAEGQRVSQTLFEGFAGEADDHLRAPSPRDFFYLRRKSETLDR